MKTKLMLLLLSLVLFFGCEKGYDLLLNNQEKVVLKFLFGSVELRAHRTGESYYYLYLSFDLKDNITLYKDAIQVYINNELLSPEKIDYHIGDMDDYKIIEDSFIHIEDGKKLYLGVTIHKPFKKGDKLTFVGNDAIFYKGEKYSIGELNIYFEEDFPKR